MAHIKDEEKRFIKGVFTYYNGKYTGQEILGIINNRRGHVSNHINPGRIVDVKNDATIPPMPKDEVDKWIKNYSNSNIIQIIINNIINIFRR